jgi:hypothetical protein
VEDLTLVQKLFQEFLTGWVKEHRVKWHRFYVIVPLSRTLMPPEGLSGRRKTPSFEELSQRVEIVTRNLKEIGFECRRLGDRELLELYASCFDSGVNDG